MMKCFPQGFIASASWLPPGLETLLLLKADWPHSGFSSHGIQKGTQIQKQYCLFSYLFIYFQNLLLKENYSQSILIEMLRCNHQFFSELITTQR